MMGFNLQLGDALRSESVTAIDDAIRAIARQEIDRTPRTKFCDACAYMHQPEISARCCCVACHGDDVPAWAQRMTTPPSSEKTGEGRSASGSTGARTSVACDPSLPTPAPSPASPVKPCPFCGGPARLVSHESSEVTNYWYEVHCDKCGAMGPSADCEWDGNSEHAKRDAIEAWNRRTPAPSPATGESAIEGILDDEACRARSVSLDVVRVKLMQRVEAARAELASLRAELNDAQVQEYMSRCRGDVLAEINDALRAELESLRASAESAPMPTREREEILKNDEIALAIADGMARCADVFCDQAQPDRRREAARMTHKRLADSRELLAAVHADVVRLRSALAEKEKAGVDVRAICLHVVNDLERQHGEGIETLDLPTRDRVWHSVRRALHAALGAKERET